MAHENDPAEHDLPGQREYRPEGYDIGVVFKSPFADDNWVRKVVVMGLIGLIPIVGWLNLMGFVKASYQAKKRDALDLPEAGFGYIADGFTVFIAFLPLGILVAVVQGILGALSGDGGIVAGLFGLVGLVVGLAFAFLTPAILYVAVRDNDLAASLRFATLKGIAIEGIGSYMLLLVTMFLLSLLANVGGVLICIGAIFTTPLAAAMTGAALAEFERDIERK